MQYRNNLSALGLGCMRFPRTPAGINQEKADALVLQAVNSGVNYFDTAYLYAGSEAALGAALKKHNLREKVFIATKLPISNCRATADFERFWRGQLAALQTDYIDYYLMHNINSLAQWEELCALGIEDFIKEKKQSGAIRKIGFSFHGLQAEFLKLLEAYDWEFCQIQYNYVNENYQAGRAGLKAAAEKGLPVIIMEPLLGGKLAKGLPPAAVSAMKDANPAKTPAEWALGWLLDQPEVTVVLSGMNSPEQLEENIKTAENTPPNSFSEQEHQTIDKVKEIFKAADKIPCTGCEYCLPCPKGVNIPNCFAAYNASYIHGRITSWTMYITSTAANRKTNSLPKNCARCGKCETHCPQNIEIQKQLENVRKRLEPWYIRLILAIVRK